MEEWGTIDTADFITIFNNIGVVQQTKNGYDDILQASTSPSENAIFYSLKSNLHRLIQNLSKSISDNQALLSIQLLPSFFSFKGFLYITSLTFFASSHLPSTYKLDNST